jgi:hypothetical protein
MILLITAYLNLLNLLDYMLHFHIDTCMCIVTIELLPNLLTCRNLPDVAKSYWMHKTKTNLIYIAHSIFLLTIRLQLKVCTKLKRHLVRRCLFPSSLNSPFTQTIYQHLPLSLPLCKCFLNVIRATFLKSSTFSSTINFLLHVTIIKEKASGTSLRGECLQDEQPAYLLRFCAHSFLSRSLFLDFR